jgi:hypothetical protein
LDDEGIGSVGRICGEQRRLSKAERRRYTQRDHERSESRRRWPHKNLDTGAVTFTVSFNGTQILDIQRRTNAVVLGPDSD